MFWRLLFSSAVGLKQHSLAPSDISYAIGTHGHSDHIGNLNLFTQAQHIVGYTIHTGDSFYLHPFECGKLNALGEAVVMARSIIESLRDWAE